MRFKGKKAVVVGAADKSIGQAIAKQLAAEGAEVCIWDINTESAGITAKAITDAKGKVKVMEVNAMEAASLKGAVEASIKEMGGIDYMVDTVGGGVFKQFAEYEDGFFEQQVAFNGFTMANCARAILPHFTEKGEGKMLFFISATGGTPGLAGYQAGKAIIKSVMETLVAELAGTKININALLPGIVATPLTINAFAAMGLGEQEVQASLGARNPRGLNTQEEVAKVACWILSEEADRLTGQLITMN